jgi:hypothetical protein
MKQITAILFLTFFCHFNSLYSQTKTPYEKKVDKIMTEMCKVIGVENSLIQMALKLNDWDIVRTSQDFAFKCKMMDKNELLVVVLATEQKLKEAEKIKTEVDFKKKKVKEVKEKQQKEQQLSSNLKRFSDLTKLKSEIKSEFLKWVKKGEFETNSEYQTRTKYKEQIIDSISFEFISRRLNSLAQKDFTNTDEVPYYIELLNYNADIQMYNVDFVCRSHTGFPYCGTYQNYDERFSVILNLNTENAKKIKQLSGKYRFFTNSDADVIWFCNRAINYSVKLTDWLISSNGYFFPRKYEILNETIQINNQNSTPLNNLTFNTSELELTEYFNSSHIINIENFNSRKLLLKREKMIKLAENQIAENNLDKALKFYKEANLIQNTEDIKLKIEEIDLKIIERKRKELITSAEQFLIDGTAMSSVEKLEKAKEFLNQANKLKFIENDQFKILEIEEKIIKIKQNTLIELAEQNQKSGKMSKSIENLEDAQKLKQRNDLMIKIQGLKKDRFTAISNHQKLDSLFTLIQSEKLKLFNEIVTSSSLDNIKNGYGLKYLECKTTIVDKIDSLWSKISNNNSEINRNRNREVWDDKSEELLQKLNEFRNELGKNSNFEINVQKALLEKDKKYLKIFKEDNVNVIIDAILKTN